MNPVEHALFFASLFSFLKWLIVLNIGIFGAWTIYVLGSSKPRRRSHKYRHSGNPKGRRLPY